MHNFPSYSPIAALFILITVTDHTIFALNSNMSSTSKAILWDVDGTLSDSYMLGFTSTKNVLLSNNIDMISEKEYHEGTKFTTPMRLAWHATGNPNDPIGEVLAHEFDDLYVKLVSTDTAPLFPGVREILYRIKSSSSNYNLKYGALSNACGDYVKAVLKVNALDDLFFRCIGS